MNDDAAPVNRIVVAAVSFGLAFLLWVVIQLLQPVGWKVVSAPVLFVDVDKYQGRYLFSQPKPEEANIRIDGPADQVQDADDKFLRQNGVFVYADLNNVHSGSDSYPVRMSFRKNSPYTFTLLTSEVRLDVQEPKRRRLPVTVEATGQMDPERNLAYNGAITEPGIVYLTGPKSAVDQVKKVRVFLDLSAVQPHSFSMAPVEAVDEGDNVVSDVSVSPELVKVTPQVAPAATTRTVLVEQIFKGHPAMGYSVTNFVVEPNQVAIQGPIEVIGNLHSVPTQPINIEGVRTSTSYEIPLQLPPGVKTYSTRLVRVHVVIEPTPAQPSGSDR